MSITAVRAPSRRFGGVVREVGREQAHLAAGQLLAGVGNLAFALVCAHLLSPREYSRLAAFLAAYLLLYMPFSALSASGALAPAAAQRRRPASLGLGALAGCVLLVAAATGLGRPLGLGAGLIVVLGLAAPVAGLLALERGRALGQGRRPAAVRSLLVEPLLRLGVGIPGALAAGATGAAAAVILGGYAATAAAAAGARPQRAADSTGPGADAAGLGGSALTAAFLLLALIQNQDVLWANAQLSTGQAARFAVLSTLGGIAAFASTTVPLVYLPRARAGERGALGTALGVAALLGGAALVPAVLDGRLLVTAIFGSRYAADAGLIAPYLLAMALLGIGRVLVAHRCAAAPSRSVLGLLVATAALQALLIASFGHSARAVALCTLAAAAMVTGGLAAARPLRAVTRARALTLSRPSITTLSVAGLTVVGAALRITAGRSLWLDEATSITQARMPFASMIHSLQSTDVQPPLHDVVLWVLDRALGDGAAVMRAPSLLAGTLLIPLLYALGRDLWDRRTGLTAALLGTVAPFLIWYSQEARMYALFLLFATLALWAQVRILRDDENRHTRLRWGWWGLYALATADLAWTQYFGSLFALVQQAAFVVAIVRRREHRRSLIVPWLVSGLVVLACIAPLLPFVYHQYQVNQASGRGFGVTPSQNGTDLEAGHRTPTVYAVLTNLVWGVWGYHSAATMQALTALWPMGMLLALALIGRGRSPRVTLLAALALVPIAVLFVVGQLKPFLFEIRYFCGAVPVALLLLARLCTRWPGRRTVGVVLMTAVLAGSFAAGFADQQFSQTNPRVYDFQGALARISSQIRPGDVLLYQPQYLNDLVSYYTPKAHSAPLTADPARLAPHGRVFVMASFQEQPQNASFVRGALTRLRAVRHEIEGFHRPQVQVWVFR